MFFSARLPRSSNVAFTRPATASWTLREITMPPAGASPSKARSDIDAIAVKVVAIDDKVAQVQAHTEYQAPYLGLVAVGLGHRLLKLDSCGQRIHGAGELDQGPVAGQLDQPASVLASTGSRRSDPVLAQARQRTALVPAHQAGVADNIRRNDGRQSALLSGQ